MKKENNKAAARNQKLLQECNTTYVHNGHQIRPLLDWNCSHLDT